MIDHTNPDEEVGEVEPLVEPVVEEVDEEARREAAEMGWVDKDQFRGNPDDWVDAKDFVRRGREVLPILRKNNERLLAKLRDVEQQRMEDRKTFDEFRKFQEQSIENQKEQALQQLREARKNAIANADGESFEEIETRIRQVEAYQPPEAVRAKPQDEAPPPPPEFTDWLDRNRWYANDKTLHVLADTLSDEVIAEGVIRPGTPDFLEEISRRVRLAAPAKFRNPARSQPASVDAPSPRSRKPAGKTYNDLPDNAKKACDDFVRVIPGFTREKYVQNYEWS